MRFINTLMKHHYLVILAEVILALLFLLLLPRHSRAQERQLIHGVVYELESKMPLTGAHVMLNGSSYGTISGPDGSFRLSIASFPATLKASHIGYNDRFFVVENAFKDDTLFLGMQFSAEMLEGVTITDKKVETIFRDEAYSVLDFEFHENGLMLLIYRNRLNSAELVLLSTMNDTLAFMPKIPGKAQSLHRDCMNYIHYVAKDSAYQIHFTGDQLQLIHPSPLEIFIPVANAFAAYHHGYYYFALNRMQKQIIEYIRYDSISETYMPFREVFDKKKLQILRDNPEHYGMLANLVSDRMEFDILLMGTDESFKRQKAARDMERSVSIEAHYLREMVYTPLYAPLFKSDKQLLLFNHPESRIEFLDPYGKLIKSTNIEYHQNKDWCELILKDQIQDQYYAVYEKMNRVSLRSINVNTGEMGMPTSLYYPFVKKILIRNGYAYFTYRQKGSTDRVMLFRQKIKEESIQYSTAGR